jgi:phosphoglycerate dehydrogenase-like enzyme
MYIFLFMRETSDVSKSKFYVYLLISIKDFGFYIGFTSDLRNRLIAHGKGEVKSTKLRRPFKLIHYEYFINEADAKARERFLKSGFGRKQLKASLRRTLNKLNKIDNMKIAIFLAQSRFTPEQQKKLANLGQVVYVEDKKELSLEKLLALAAGADIIVPDPDPFGGFEKVKPVLMKVIESLPNLKGVCLSTTSFGWVDLDYCKKRNLPVSNVPGYSKESVAEHALALLLCLAKKIIVLDRRYHKGEYKIEMGNELKGKTLGIIGLGNIGGRVAELAMGVGMKVIANDVFSKNMKGVEMKSLDEVLTEADFISLHTTHEDKNKNLISRDQIAKMKEGVIIVNTVDRDLVNEQDMAEALKSGKVSSYAYEAEDLENTPLAKLDNAVGLKGFAYYTKEALANLFQIVTDNILALAKGTPQNRVI